MDSFDELGLDPALVDALAAEGVERATAFQLAAIPVIRRGNNLVGQVGPGSGALIAYGAGLLDRLDPEGDPVQALVLCPTSDEASKAAEAVARLAASTGHTVAALGGVWALPERAQIVFGTPAQALGAMKSSTIKLGAVQALVLDQASSIASLGALPAVEAILESLPSEAQRIVLALPVNAEVRDLVEGHVKRAVTLPPRPVDEAADADSPHRGSLRYRITGDPNTALLETVHEALSDDARHVLVYFASEDRAADGGDYLTLHGYVAGAPGDTSVPVWLGVDESEARQALDQVADPSSVATVSFDVPGDPDSLDRRHGGGGESTILISPIEVAHLRDTAHRTGYTLTAAPTPQPEASERALTELRGRIEETLTERDLLGEMLLLQPLYERWAPAEVAAAVLALHRHGDGAKGSDLLQPAAVESGRPTRAAPTWARLFISIGARDGVGPGDLVGAISGESGIEASRIGKIEIRDNFSLAEVEEGAAEAVIKALNGTTIRGRSVRVDYDRGSRSPARPGRGAGSRGAARGGQARSREGGDRPRSRDR